MRPLKLEDEAKNLLPLGMSLYPFQRDGIAFLSAQPRALLADEMGLGKTIQTIMGLRIKASESRRTGTLLSAIVVCPKSLVPTWKKELKVWAPELVTSVVAGQPPERSELWAEPAHVRIVTYETLQRDVEDGRVLAANPVDTIVLDEAQKIRNPGTKTTRAIRSLDVDTRWALTGTPLENRLEDPIAIFDYLKPGLFPVWRDGLSAAHVRELIAPFVLRRRKADMLLDLPEKIVETEWLELDTKQRRLYDNLLLTGRMEQSRGGFQRIAALALITKLKLICNGDETTGEGAKLERLRELLQEIKEANEKALVFSQYPEKTLRVLLPTLKSYGAELYSGGLSGSEREAMLTRFRGNPHQTALLLSLKAGGLGLTLTEASNVVHFDQWWNPAVMNQAEDRAHRIGQRRTVSVIRLLVADTVEEKIEAILIRKIALFRDVVDGLTEETVIGRLTDEDLCEILGIDRGPRLRA